MDFDKIHTLASAIINTRLGRASDAERSVVLEWLDESDENRKLYRDIIRFVSAGNRIRLERQIMDSTDFDKVRDSVIRRLGAESKVKTRRVRRIGIGAAAAGIAAVMLVILGLGEGQSSRDGGNHLADAAPSANVELILPSGEKVDIERSDMSIEELLASEHKAALSDPEHPEAIPESMSRLITQREGQASFTLEDGTQVWMNTMSSLDFPAVFADGPRIVRLEGEAYFDVARDETRPFIVEAGGVLVKALGTSFNVQAYDDMPEIATTLLSGSVEVTPADGGQRMLLHPGMQSLWNRESGSHTSAAVSAGDVTAWRHGEFIFTEQPLETVLRTLSRWYDAEFVYPEGRSQSHTLTGKTLRTHSLEQSLRMITATGGPLFEIKGNRVYILER